MSVTSIHPETVVIPGVQGIPAVTNTVLPSVEPLTTPLPTGFSTASDFTASAVPAATVPATTATAAPPATPAPAAPIAPFVPDETWLNPAFPGNLRRPDAGGLLAADVTKITNADEGMTFLTGGQKVSQGSANVTAVRHAQYGDGSEVRFFLNPGESRKLETQLTTEGKAQTPFIVDEGAYDPALNLSVIGGQQLAPMGMNYTPEQAFRFEEPNKYVLDFVGSNGDAMAYKGFVRARVFGATADARRENLTAALAAAHLEGVGDAPDPAYARKVVANALLAQTNPAQADEYHFNLGEVSEADLGAALTAAGVDASRVSNASIAETFPGSTGVLDPALSQSVRDAGLRGVFVGLSQLDTVPRLLKSDGLMSYFERSGRGIVRPGASNSSDEQSGGARSAFTRGVTDSATGSLASSFGAGQAQLLSTGEPLARLMERTDWYGYPGDEFGAAVDAPDEAAEPALANSSHGDVYAHRLAAVPLMQAIQGDPTSTAYNAGFKPSNELCFNAGVPNVWTHVLVGSEANKASLIGKLQAEGIQDFNGLPFDQAILVASDWATARSQLAAQNVTGFTAPAPPPAPATP